MPTAQTFQVLVTAPSREDAENLAAFVLERRLAACCQIAGPIHSRYWWNGHLESADEFLCMFKTVDDRLEELVTAVRSVHRYEVPEIVALPIVAGHEPYLAWVMNETRG